MLESMFSLVSHAGKGPQHTPDDDLHLVHDEKKTTNGLGCRLAVIEGDKSTHSTYPEAGNEAADGELNDGVLRASLNRGADSENGSPKDNRALTANAVRGESLCEGADEGPRREKGGDDGLPRRVERVRPVAVGRAEATHEVGHDETAGDDL
jgi:hypothetical protein